MTLAEALDAYVAAREDRQRVCRGDCKWPLGGDGECFRCAREAAALKAVVGIHLGRSTEGSPE